jgi:hypothetical protein
MTAKDEVDPGPIALLDAIWSGAKTKTWEVMAPRCGVTNPDPPWRTSLVAMCECLDASGLLPTLDRRKAEDELSQVYYGEVPTPERELLELVHTMISRGLLLEADLTSRIRIVRARLEDSSAA